MATIFVGSWRNWQTRHAQTVQIGVRIPASRPFPAEGRDGDLGGLISLENAGSMPASATNSRFVQWKDGGPTNRARGFDSLTGYQHSSVPQRWAKANGAPRVRETRTSRFDSDRSPQFFRRRVVG